MLFETIYILNILLKFFPGIFVTHLFGHKGTLIILDTETILKKLIQNSFWILIFICL